MFTPHVPDVVIFPVITVNTTRRFRGGCAKAFEVPCTFHTSPTGPGSAHTQYWPRSSGGTARGGAGGGSVLCGQRPRSLHTRDVCSWAQVRPAAGEYSSLSSRPLLSFTVVTWAPLPRWLLATAAHFCPSLFSKCLLNTFHVPATGPGSREVQQDRLCPQRSQGGAVFAPSGFQMAGSAARIIKLA